MIEDSAYSLDHSDDKRPTPSALENPQECDRTVTFCSGGKMYNITGLRVGSAVGPKDVVIGTADAYLTET